MYKEAESHKDRPVLQCHDERDNMIAATIKTAFREGRIQ